MSSFLYAYWFVGFTIDQDKDSGIYDVVFNT